MAFVSRACVAAGASQPVANSLSEATVSAELYGRSSVGFLHLPDYLAGFRSGSIDGQAEPVITVPTSALIQVDARSGIAQLGFDLAFDDLCQRASTHGIAAFVQRNSYTAGEVGYYGRRLAQAGIVSMAVANGPPLMSPPGARRAVYCTNPLAFAAPANDGVSVLIDQAASQTAYVNLREAAANGEDLPEGWALDADGEPTIDPTLALAGSLTTFGGARGANIALMVEILAAGLTGANWSMDAPSFDKGDQSPGAGLFIIAIAASKLDPTFGDRLGTQIGRLAALGVHIPGLGKSSLPPRTDFTVPSALAEHIENFGESGGSVGV